MEDEFIVKMCACVCVCWVRFSTTTRHQTACTVQHESIKYSWCGSCATTSSLKAHKACAMDNNGLSPPTSSHGIICYSKLAVIYHLAQTKVFEQSVWWFCRRRWRTKKKSNGKTRSHAEEAKRNGRRREEEKWSAFWLKATKSTLNTLLCNRHRCYIGRQRIASYHFTLRWNRLGDGKHTDTPTHTHGKINIAYVALAYVYTYGWLAEWLHVRGCLCECTLAKIGAYSSVHVVKWYKIRDGNKWKW